MALETPVPILNFIKIVAAVSEIQILMRSGGVTFAKTNVTYL